MISMNVASYPGYSLKQSSKASVDTVSVYVAQLCVLYTHQVCYETCSI